MDETKKKRLRQRLAADLRAGLVILALVMLGYIAGVLTVRAAWGGFPAQCPADKPLAAAMARSELPRLTSLGEFLVTYYCCEQRPHICGTGDNLTATGVPAAPGIVAVDPAVIPLGSTVLIEGQAYLAADTGGLIKGNRIDIAVETHAEALELGVRRTEVWVVPE